MCEGFVSWCTFDWQSFATLTTGLFAVLAAYFVGKMQSQIQSRQADIQEASLRTALFDRRYRVFEKAEQFLREIMQTGDDPSIECQREFAVASGEARFLFSANVSGELKEIWGKWAEFHALRRTMEHSFRTKGHYGEGQPEAEREALTWFSERFQSLPELFGELKLDFQKLKVS